MAAMSVRSLLIIQHLESDQDGASVFAVCSSVGRAPVYREVIGSIPIGGTTIQKTNHWREAYMDEHRPDKPKAVGSNPTPPTTITRKHHEKHQKWLYSGELPLKLKGIAPS